MRRASLFLRHLSQSTVACLTAMTQGDLSTVTVGHWLIAMQTGTGAGILAVLLSFGNLIKLQANRYGIALIAFVGTIIADLLVHPTHYGEFFTEALVTGTGAAVLSLLVSFTPIDKVIARLK